MPLVLNAAASPGVASWDRVQDVSAVAKTRTVASDGGQYTSIKTAVEAAVAGDTILVYPERGGSEAVTDDVIAGARPEQIVDAPQAASGVPDALQALTEHAFYIPNATPGEMLWVTFTRLVAGDTFTGRVHVLGQQVVATFWR